MTVSDYISNNYRNNRTINKIEERKKMLIRINQSENTSSVLVSSHYFYFIIITNDY